MKDPKTIKSHPLWKKWNKNFLEELTRLFPSFQWKEIKGIPSYNYIPGFQTEYGNYIIQVFDVDRSSEKLFDTHAFSILSSPSVRDELEYFEDKNLIRGIRRAKQKVENLK